MPFIRLPKDFGWKAYFLLYVLGASVRLAGLFSSDYPPHIYYHILAAFDKILSIHLVLHVMSCIIDALSAVPIYCYIRKVRFLPKIFWKTLFCLRIVFNLVGRKFEMSFLISLFYMDVKIGLAYIVSSVSLQLPSYLLQYRYAFQQEKFLKP